MWHLQAQVLVNLCLCVMLRLVISQGLNVLYITLEMGTEERIAERIDANLFDVTIDELYDMPKNYMIIRLDKTKSKNKVN